MRASELKWIRIEDELPPRGQWVIAFNQNHHPKDMPIWVEIAGLYGPDMNPSITHWCNAIPELPFPTHVS